MFPRCASLLLALSVCASAEAADNSAALAASLKADYPLTRVGANGLKFDYDHIVQPGVVLRVRIPGIYADPANTPQAIVNTNIVNGQAQMQRGLLSALSNTSQGRTLNLDEPVYVTRLDVHQDNVHLELVTAADGYRFRAEVKFTVANLAGMDAAAVEQVIGSALSGSPQSRSSSAAGAGGLAPSVNRQTPGARGPRAGVPSRPGVAQISPEQQSHIQAQIAHAPASLKQQADAAAPALQPFLELMSCINDYAAVSQLQVYLGPHAEGLNMIVAPFVSMHFHDKGSCLEVTRLQGWQALSLNAFQFQAVYTAADSGESTVRSHIAQREPDGTWLMNQ